MNNKNKLKNLLKEINEIELYLNINLDDYLIGEKDIDEIELKFNNYCKKKIKENNGKFPFNDFLSLMTCINLEYNCETKNDLNKLLDI